MRVPSSFQVDTFEALAGQAQTLEADAAKGNF